MASTLAPVSAYVIQVKGPGLPSAPVGLHPRQSLVGYVLTLRAAPTRVISKAESGTMQAPCPASHGDRRTMLAHQPVCKHQLSASRLSY